MYEGEVLETCGSVALNKFCDSLQLQQPMEERVQDPLTAAGRTPSSSSSKSCISPPLASSLHLRSVTSFVFRNNSIPQADYVRDLKYLLRTSVIGMKTAVGFLVNHYSYPAAVGSMGSSSSLEDSEIELLSCYFKWMLEVLRLLARHKSKIPAPTPLPNNASSSISSCGTASGGSSSAVASVLESPATLPRSANSNRNKPLLNDEELKEVSDYFATVFTAVDPNLLRVIVTPHMDALVELAVAYPLFLAIPQYLISHSTSSPVMAEILLTYLIKRMPDLSHPLTGIMQQPSSTLRDRADGMDNNDRANKASTLSAAAQTKGLHSSTLLRLFKMVFGSVATLHDNERVVRPKLHILILSALRMALESRVSVNYCFVLRTLFRAISTGKFEEAYKETSPLLSYMLSGEYVWERRLRAQAWFHILLSSSLTYPILCCLFCNSSVSSSGADRAPYDQKHNIRIMLDAAGPHGNITPPPFNLITSACYGVEVEGRVTESSSPHSGVLGREPTVGFPFVYAGLSAPRHHDECVPTS